MDLLPPHLKHKILSLDPKLQSAAYGDDKTQKNSEDKNNNNNGKIEYPSLSVKDSSKLHTFSPSQINSLQEDGYLVVDNLFGRDSLLRYKV